MSASDQILLNGFLIYKAHKAVVQCARPMLST
jgi:hypothetical protein